MPWTKLPAWTGTVHLGCLTCTPVPDNASLCQLDRPLALGFGVVTVTKDGTCLYDQQEWMHSQGHLDPLGMTDDELDAALAADGEDLVEYPTLATYEARATADPDHDWRVHFFAPLHEEEYQRQGPEAWVLIRSGEGFA
jgi:hypothetical protein